MKSIFDIEKGDLVTEPLTHKSFRVVGITDTIVKLRDSKGSIYKFTWLDISQHFTVVE